MDVARVESWNLLIWNASRITCVKSQYIVVKGIPYSTFAANSMSHNFHPCIFVPLIPFSQFYVSQFQRIYIDSERLFVLKTRRVCWRTLKMRSEAALLLPWWRHSSTPYWHVIRELATWSAKTPSIGLAGLRCPNGTATGSLTARSNLFRPHAVSCRPR